MYVPATRAKGCPKCNSWPRKVIQRGRLVGTLLGHFAARRSLAERPLHPYLLDDIPIQIRKHSPLGRRWVVWGICTCTKLRSALLKGNDLASLSSYSIPSSCGSCARHEQFSAEIDWTDLYFLFCQPEVTTMEFAIFELQKLPASFPQIVGILADKATSRLLNLWT